jgi:hypothetical protein
VHTQRTRVGRAVRIRHYPGKFSVSGVDPDLSPGSTDSRRSNITKLTLAIERDGGQAYRTLVW